MTRNKLLKRLASAILEKQKDSPLFVGIDGVDASGKTTLAEELVNELKESGRQIILASIDGFHCPKSIRYSKGENSPEGYYFDSFDYKAVVNVLLEPLSSDTLQYTRAVFDYRTNSKVVSPVQTATKDSILIMEGIFLFRPELLRYWDIKIFVDADFKITVDRAIRRDDEREKIGAKQDIINKYKKRYIPAQQIYFKNVKPKEKADIIIDNNNFENPVITKD